MSEVSKDKDLNPAASPIDENESLAKLENAIAENDPEFQAHLQSISEIAGDNLNIELVDLDAIMEQAKSKTLKARWQRFLIFVEVQILRLKTFLLWFFDTLVRVWVPQFLGTLKKSLGEIQKIQKKFQQSYRKFGRLQKFLFLFLLGGSGFLFYYIYSLFHGGFLKNDEKLFIYSMEELAERKNVYEKEETEEFYGSPRLNQNLVALRRVVVNLKKSKNSSDNPMGAFEFFLQGNSSDVTIEIKDREAEILDLFQFEIRAFNYDELETVEGKNKLSEVLRVAINRLLIKGKITKIYFKNFVVKH